MRVPCAGQARLNLAGLTQWLVAIGLLLGSGTLHAAQSAALNYLQHCAGCHQSGGEGLPRSGIPSMAGNVGYFLNTEQGRAFLVQVPGTAHSPLSHREVAELLNWLVSRFSAAQRPAQAADYTEAEVAKLRAHRLNDLQATRKAIVTELNRRGFPAY